MRNKQVEGLRSFAICLVIIFHFFCRFQQIYMDNEMVAPYPVNLFGGVGVGIFLLITGYFAQKSDGGGKMLFKRAKKLYPMYIIAITIIFLITHIFYLPDRTVTFKQYILNLFLLGGIPGVPYVDGSHWYLRTTLFLIILLSVIQRLREKIRIASYYVVVIIIMICKVLYTYYDQIAIAKLIKAAYIFIGLDSFIVAFIGVGISLFMSNKRTSGLILSLLCVVFDFFLFNLFHTVSIIAFSFLLILCLYNKIPFLEKKPFQVVAASSYSIYLIHQNIGFLILLLLIRFADYQFWMGATTTITVLLLGIGASIIIETPMNNLIEIVLKKVVKQSDTKSNKG